VKYKNVLHKQQAEL